MFNYRSIAVVAGRFAACCASAALEQGRIQLQSEGAEVFFRNIEIRSIAALPADKP